MNLSTDKVAIPDAINDFHYGQHEFLYTKPVVAITCLIILILASIVGTCGNILILVVIATNRKVRNVESIFIINLAISDLYVTLIADPMSIVAKLEGEVFFASIPYLCQTIASICTVSCVGSLMTIALMSVNRYFFICRHDTYKKIFTNRNCIIMCFSVYGIGTTLVLLNLAGIGDHSFDRKSLECIWDRMETYPYTIVFSVTLVWIPSVLTGISFLKIYLYVRGHRRKVLNQNELQEPFRRSHSDRRNIRLAKTLFIIYAIFFTCWVPYSMLMIVDTRDTFPHELHVLLTMFAHLHPSINWLIYYLTNKRFADAYKEILSNMFCRKVMTHIATITSTNSPNETSPNIHGCRDSGHTKRLFFPVEPFEFNKKEVRSHTFDNEDLTHCSTQRHSL